VFRTIDRDVLSGSLLWNVTTGSGFNSSPTVVDGVVYVGCDDNKIYAFNAGTGALVWSYTTGGRVRSSPAVVDVVSPWTSLTLGIPGSAVAIPIATMAHTIQMITILFINLLLLDAKLLSIDRS
jgi:glucose dehydrogenase